MFTKKNIASVIVIIIFGALVVFEGCSSASKLETVQKSGAQLWGENCVRCHNAPSPDAFSDDQWETIAQHMRVRASLDSEQTAKIVEFLKMAN